MKLIVGLGNIGKEYVNTRHNIGFMMLDALSDAWDFSFKEESKFKGALGVAQISGEKVFFLKPSTYMNLSGEATVKVANYYNITEENILVIYDDMDLDIGERRFKKKGSSGGQKGMGNIIECFETKEIPRLKIGIGKRPPEWNGKDYVLSNFSKEEQKAVNEVIKASIDGVLFFIKEGIEKTMNEKNGK